MNLTDFRNLPVEEQTEAICLEAVKAYGYALRHVKKQTPEICLAAVQQNGWALECVKKQTLAICLAAVKQNGIALQYVQQQTPEIVLAALKQESEAMKHVRVTDFEESMQQRIASILPSSTALSNNPAEAMIICLSVMLNEHTMAQLSPHDDMLHLEIELP